MSVHRWANGNISEPYILSLAEIWSAYVRMSRACPDPILECILYPSIKCNCFLRPYCRLWFWLDFILYSVHAQTEYLLWWPCCKDDWYVSRVSFLCSRVCLCFHFSKNKNEKKGCPRTTKEWRFRFYCRQFEAPCSSPKLGQANSRNGASKNQFETQVLGA